MVKVTTCNGSLDFTCSTTSTKQQNITNISCSQKLLFTYKVKPPWLLDAFSASLVLIALTLQNLVLNFSPPWLCKFFGFSPKLEYFGIITRKSECKILVSLSRFKQYIEIVHIDYCQWLQEVFWFVRIVVFENTLFKSAISIEPAFEHGCLFLL